MIIIKGIISKKTFLMGLTGFVVLQIFIDMYRVFFESKYQIFGIALPELINLLYLAVLTVAFFAINYKTPKVLVPVCIYTVALSAYMVFHIVNVTGFDQNILSGSELNWFKEVYFIIRTYLIPVYVFYYFICSDMDLSCFKKLVNVLSLVISSNIILTNVFKVSFICYSSTLENNSFITRNIFEWFYNPDIETPSFMTSKGWFYMGNQIGLILLMLLPFVIMNAVEKGKLASYITVFLNGLAMIIVGTKVATLGCCVVMISGLIIALVFGAGLKQFEFKSKSIIIYATITAVCMTIVPFSPMFALQEERSEAYEVTDEQETVMEQIGNSFESLQRPQVGETEKDPETIKKELEEFKKSFCEYVNTSPYFFGVDPEFLELFPMEENFDFWYNIVINSNYEQVNYRNLKSAIYEEVLRVNGNETADRFLGIGYISNFPYSERDFVSQNIWFGYIGTALLVGPYYLLVAWGILLALKRIKTCFIYQNAFFALSIGASTVLSILAGHLFFGVFSITVFAFVSAGFLRFQTERYNNR